MQWQFASLFVFPLRHAHSLNYYKRFLLHRLKHFKRAVCSLFSLISFNFYCFLFLCLCCFICFAFVYFAIFSLPLNYTSFNDQCICIHMNTAYKLFPPLIVRKLYTIVQIWLICSYKWRRRKKLWKQKCLWIDTHTHTLAQRKWKSSSASE